MLWFTSDTHWGHANIIKYSNRPFDDVNQMNEALIANWNAVVSPKDTVYHLGDVAFMPYKEFKAVFRRLHGNKHIILGNHDSVIESNLSDILKDKTLGIYSVQNYLEVRSEGQKLVLFHYGMRVWNRSHHGSIHLYGHSHGSLPPHGKSVDVGVDSIEITSEYRPVSLKEVVKYMDNREASFVDHHKER